MEFLSVTGERRGHETYALPTLKSSPAYTKTQQAVVTVLRQLHNFGGICPLPAAARYVGRHADRRL